MPPTQAGTKRIGALAKWIVILTAIVAITTVLTAAMSAGVAQDAKDFLDETISEEEFTSATAPLNAVQFVTSIATLATGVLTIIWAFRIAGNVRAFGRATTWSPLFAIFGWFLPPMVLYVIPFLVLRELWKASEPTTAAGDSWKRVPDNRILWFWFAVFGIIPAALLAVEIGNLASAGLPTADMQSVAESLEDFGAIGYITAVVSVAAAAAWIMFVRQLTPRHMRLTGEK